MVVYYAIALGLYLHSSYREVLRCLLEGVQWLLDPAAALKVAGNSGISQARTRLGWEPLRQLHDEVVKPIAVAATKGAWYRGLRLVSVDGSTLEVADESANSRLRPPGSQSRQSAFPQLRFVALVENGTHVLFGTQMGTYASSEITLAKDVLTALARGCCAWPTDNSSASSSGSRPRHRRRSAVADQEQCRPAVRAALGRWLLFEPHLPHRQRSSPPAQRAEVRVIEYRLKAWSTPSRSIDC